MTLIWRPGYITTFADPDVQSYLTRVEEADNQGLEYPVAVAIDEFIRGCKADGIWNAIKASCILAGARTLNGALQPLVGSAPTNFNFVSGDYNRTTGLVGNGSTKYLDSNRSNNADPQNSNHISTYMSTAPTSGVSLIGADVTGLGSTAVLSTATRSRNVIGINWLATLASGFAAISRNNGSSYVQRFNSQSATPSQVSETPASVNFTLYARRPSGGGSVSLYSNARLAFYSIGESLDLAQLDARVTTLINRFAVVIP